MSCVIKDTFEVTLTLSKVQAETLVRLLGNHVAGVGNERGTLESIWRMMDQAGMDAHDTAPLFLRPGYDLLKCQ